MAPRAILKIILSLLVKLTITKGRQVELWWCLPLSQCRWSCHDQHWKEQNSLLPLLTQCVVFHSAHLSTFLILWQDLSVNMSVQSSISTLELLQECIALITNRWLEWSSSHDLPEDMAHLKCKGVHITGEKDCIQQYFAKKPRGGVAMTESSWQYNFSIILDIHLVVRATLALAPTTQLYMV